MSGRKKISQKAVETVTFRLTQKEKRLLEYVASVENKTNTDLIKDLVLEKAEELNIKELPPLPIKKRPGRPKKIRADKTDAASHTELIETDYRENEKNFKSVKEEAAKKSEIAIVSESVISPQQTNPENSTDTVISTVKTAEKGPLSLDYLATAFKNHFASRSEGTKRELKDALDYLIYNNNLNEFVTASMQLNELNEQHLAALRTSLKDAVLKFSKKNLYLTYLRMMLQWGMKKGYLKEMDLNSCLKGFSAREVADAWSAFDPL
jgi:hypothetical protein